MAQFPVPGDRPYSNKLKNYIDQADAEVLGQVTELAEEVSTGAVLSEGLRLAAMFAGANSGVVNPQALGGWRAALAAGFAKMAIAGDSISEGTNATAAMYAYPAQTQARLRDLTEMGGGAGYIPAVKTTGAIVPNLPVTTVGTHVMGGWGLGGRALQLHDPAHHATYAAQACDRVRVWYGKTDTLGGGLKVLIDGVDQGITLSSQGVSNSDGHFWDSPALEPGDHVVKIVASSGFIGILDGVEYFNGDSPLTGLRVYNGGHFGYQTSDFLTPNMAMHWQHLAAIDPDLTVIFLGANDLYAGTSVSAFLTNMEAILTKTDGSVLLIGGYLRGEYGDDVAKQGIWQQMQAGLKARAVGRVAYLDIAPHWPSLKPDGSTDEGLMSDRVHPSNLGMERIAEILAAALGSATDRSFSFTATGGLIEKNVTTPFIPELGNVNEWDIPNPVQVQLPNVPKGATFLVHVKTGFQKITWPNGTEIYGETDQQEAWVTLTRSDGHWQVLIPSPEGGAALIDTGWSEVFSVANFGSGPQYVVGNASMLGAGWEYPIGLTSMSIRRSGNFLLVKVSGGFTKIAGGSSEFVRIPVPAGLIMDDAVGTPYLHTATVGGAKALVVYKAKVVSEGTHPNVVTTLRLNIEGAVATGTIAITQSALMFTIKSTSTWGA